MRTVITALHEHILPAVKGMDASDIEKIHQRICQNLNPRTMSGTISMALSCLDVALRDIAGKQSGRSIAAMLGNARVRIPAYVTFGFPQYVIDQLADAAHMHVASGFTALKAVVAVDKGGRREDARRIKAIRDAVGPGIDIMIDAIRDAVGPGIDIMIDANYLFNPVDAGYLCREIEDCRITWFEEPVTQNDARALGDLRRSTRIPIAAG